MSKEEYENTIRLQFEKIDKLTEKIGEAIEYIKEHTTNFDNDKLIDILEILGGKDAKN